MVGSCLKKGKKMESFLIQRPSNLLVKSMSLGSENRRSTVGYLGPT